MVGIDWSFDNLSGSHHQSQVNCESSVDVISLWSLSWLVDDLVMLLVVWQLSRDVIGCADCKTWLVCFDLSFVSQMSVGALLVKLVGLSTVCLSCCCKVQVAVGNSSNSANQLSRVIRRIVVRSVGVSKSRRTFPGLWSVCIWSGATRKYLIWRRMRCFVTWGLAGFYLRLLSRDTNFPNKPCKHISNYTQDWLRAAMNATRLTFANTHAYEACFRRSIGFCRRILWFPTSLPKSIRIRDKCLLRLGSEQVLKERGEF